MKKRDWITSIVVGILLGLIAATTGLTRLFPVPQSARAASDVDSVLTLVLNSHTKWHSVKGEAESTGYLPDGSTQTYTLQFRIAQPLMVYVDSGNKDQPGFNDNGGYKIMDGAKLYAMDKKTKTYTEGGIPKFVKDLSRMPKDLAQVRANVIDNHHVVYDHPLSLFIGNPALEYIFPEWFAQGNDLSAYKITGEDMVLGRKTWVVTLTYENGEDTAWIDETTGMILKYVKLQDGKKFAEFTMTSLQIDGQGDAGLFRVPPDYRPASAP